MARSKLFLFGLGMAGLGALLSGCATGLEGPEVQGTGGAGGSDTTTSSTSSSSATGNGGADSSNSSSSSSGGPMCESDEHLCGGICAPNTPQTGCYQSTECSPCPTITNGTTKCSNDGLCDFDCLSPYEKSGNSCSCPMQCCTAADCGSGQMCENGQCITPCDQAECLLQCLLLQKIGVCQNNMCVCM